jgi:hypothetical protein
VYHYLCTRWSVTDSTAPNIYDSYGRIYRIPDKDGSILPQAFIAGTDYRQVLADDTRAALSFFDVGDDTKSADGYKTAQCGLYFFANLSNVPLYATAAQRMDEALRNDVVSYIDQTGYGFLVTGYSTGAQAWKTYTGKKMKDAVKYRDMHPFVYFRVDLKLPNYQVNPY